MLRGSCIALVFLVAATLGVSQTAPGDTYFATTSHDFGVVPRGAQLLHRFNWTNNENSRREITEVRSSCGCVSATPLPRVLEPGQTGVIETHVDAKKFIGQKNVTVHVSIGPGKAHVVTLMLAAHSRPDVVFNPGQIQFGAVPEGATPSQDLEIEYAGSGDWQVTDVANPSTYLDVTLHEAFRKPGQVGYRVTVKLKAGAPGGDFKQVLQLRTNDPNYPVLPVLVEAIVRPSLLLVPDQVFFGNVRVQQSVQRRVTLRGDKPFRILAIEGQGQGLSALTPESAGKVQVLTVTWQPTEVTELNTELVIQTSAEKHATLRLKVQGEATK